MITLDLSILNQKGTPMFNSDTLANRPAFGIVGRIFISTDTKEFYRDTGTSWELIGGPGAGTITGTGAAGQVTYFTGASSVAGSDTLRYTPTSSFLINNSVSAASLLARGTNLTSTLTATANNDVLVGLDIVPTFVNSAFTGVTDAAIRVGGNILANAGFQYSIGTTATPFSTINAVNFISPSTAFIIAAGNCTLQSGNISGLQLFASTRNVTIQNGGTFTDNGNRLQVTGTGYFSDSVGIGATSLTGSSLRIDKNITGATTAYGIRQGGVIQSDVTSSVIFYATELKTQAATFNLSNAFYYQASQGAIGANSTITNQYGFHVLSNFTVATNNYGFYGDIAAGSNRWNLYMNGTALNYMAGSLGIKTTAPYAPSTFSLDVNGGLLVKNTAGTTAQITLINADPSIGGNNGFLVASVGGTSGGSFVEFQGYYGASLTGSTALRLNSAGGAVIVNSTTNSGEQFQLTGTLRINGQRSGTAGGSSGQHLIINLDGTQYKIALLNP